MSDAATPATDLAEAPATPAAPVAAVESPAPNIIQLAAAAVSSKAVLIRETTTLRADLAAEQVRASELERELIEANEQITELTKARTDLEGQLETVRATLQGVQAEQATAAEQAVDIVAKLGVPTAETLPGTTAAGDTVEELEAALAAEKDNTRRWELAKQINAKLGHLN